MVRYIAVSNVSEQDVEAIFLRLKPQGAALR